MPTSLIKAIQSKKSVLTRTDLALAWNETESTRLNSKIAYYVKTGGLKKLSRGLFAKDANYDPKELATSIYVPSYLSFETVLRENGVIFQHYDSFFVAARWSKKIQIKENSFIFRKLKDSILYDTRGITNSGTYSVATTERAFLDMLYLFPRYYFDNLRSLNWEKCYELLPLYNNLQLEKRLTYYEKNYA